MKSTKYAYPVVFTKTDTGFIDCYVPDFPLNTQGENAAEAILMARDAIALTGLCLEDTGKTLPIPSDIKSIVTDNENVFVSLVDVDFAEYRRKHDNKAVRRTVSLPAYMDEAATKAGINVSFVLQTALRNELELK